MGESAEDIKTTASFEQLLEDAQCNTGIFLRHAVSLCEEIDLKPGLHTELVGALVLAQTVSFGESCLTAKLNRLASAVEDAAEAIRGIALEMESEDVVGGRR